MRTVIVEWLNRPVEMSAATFGCVCVGLGLLLGFAAGLYCH